MEISTLITIGAKYKTAYLLEIYKKKSLQVGIIFYMDGQIRYLVENYGQTSITWKGQNNINLQIPKKKKKPYRNINPL